MARAPVRIIAAALVALAAVAGARWWAQRPAPAGDLELQGNVEIRQVNLAFKVGGRIKTLDVDEGATVAAGERLASLDKVYFNDSIAQLKAQRDQLKANLSKMEAGNRPEEIAQAEATLAERKATIENANTKLNRATALLKSATGTQKDYDDARAAQLQAVAQMNSAQQGLTLMRAGFRKEDIEASRAQLANGEAALQIAERQLADADLFAPSGGVVLTRVREAGAIVNAAETVFVLSLTSPVWIRTYVSEIELGHVKPGQEVEIRIDTPGAPVLKGRIGYISTTAEFTPKTVETRELRTALVYRLRVVAEDPDNILRQGMPATVRVTGAQPASSGNVHVSQERR